jgi:hypothetical protein
MNPDAGRGGNLLVKARLADGEEFLMIVDTGMPGTLLDKSLLPKLGKQLDVFTVHTFDAGVKGGLYAAPKIFLGNVQLMTGSRVFAGDLSKLLSQPKPSIKGILGIDCLRHYCVQLDFQSGTVRFLNPAQLDTAALGKSYPLEFVHRQEYSGLPMIPRAGLLGGTTTNVIIDTGNYSDGMASGRAIRQNAKGSYSGGLIKRTKHFLAVKGWVNRPVNSLNCVWDGNTYTNLVIRRGPPDYPDWIGLRFLARHLVTFDFPHAAMYLKQTSTGPLTAPAKTNHAAATQKP